MIKRRVTLYRMRPECIEQYKEYHRNVWPELVTAYRKAGIHHMSCFLSGLNLAIYSEFDEEVLTASRKDLGENQFELKWQAIMKPMADPTFQSIIFDEIFYMPQISTVSGI